MTTTAPSLVALRSDAARNRMLVLRAAERLFATRGLDVSMQDIAAEAGVGVGTVFRRFATKDDLVAAIMIEGIQQLVQLGHDAVARAEAEPWSAFAEYFMQATERHVRHRGLMEAIGTEHFSHPAVVEVRGRSIALVRELVAKAIDAGAMRDDVVAEDIPMLQCAISRASCMPIALAQPEAWRRAATLLLDGMRAGSATGRLEPGLPTFEQVFAPAAD